MAKRFTDTEKWKDEWFDQLSIMGKLFFFYFTDNCDHAGVLKSSLRRFCKDVGGAYRQEDFEREFGDRVMLLSNGSMFMPKFIKFQYGKLSKDNNAHVGVVKSLKYNGIEISPYLAPEEVLPSPLLGAQEKEQDKDTDKEKDKAGIKYNASHMPTPDQIVDLWNNALAKKLGYSHGLGVGDHLKNFFEAREFLDTPEKWAAYFEKITTFPFLMGENPRGWKVGLQWAVDYDNALKVLDGQYDNKTQAQKSLRAWFDEEVGDDTQRA